MERHTLVRILALILCGIFLAAQPLSASRAEVRNPGVRQTELGTSPIGRSGPNRHVMSQRVVTDPVCAYIDIYDPTDHSNSPGLLIRKDAQCAFMRFDVPCPIRGSQVNEARLVLRVTSRSNSRPMEVNLFRPCREWRPEVMTWNMRNRDEDEYWNIPGCGAGGDCNERASDRTQYPDNWLQVSDPGSYETLITSLVQEWANHPDSNRGIVLQSEAGYDTGCTIASSSHSIASFRPRIIVQYTPPETRDVATLTLNAEPQEIAACSDACSMVTAIVSDVYGCATYDGVPVRFETSLGEFDGGTVITRTTSHGMAATTLWSGELAGTACITATSEVTRTDHTTVRIVPGDPHHFEFELIRSQIISTPFPVVFWASDCGGNLIPSYVCSAVTITESTGTMDPIVASVADGSATFEATIEEVSDNVVFSAEGCELRGESEPFRILPTPPARFAIDLGEGLQGCISSVITITAMDWEGQPFLGFQEPVTLSVTHATITPTVTTTFTHGTWSGPVEITPQDPPPDGIRELRAQTVYGGRVISGTKAFTLFAHPDRLRWINANVTKVRPDSNGYTLTATVQLSDACELPMPGRYVTFLSSLGTFQPNPVATDGTGQATTYLGPLSFPEGQKLTLTAIAGGLVSTKQVWMGPCEVALTCLYKDFQFPQLICRDVIRDGSFEGEPGIPPWVQDPPPDLIQSYADYPWPCVEGGRFARMGDKPRANHAISQVLGYLSSPVTMTLSFRYELWDATPATDDPPTFEVGLGVAGQQPIWQDVLAATTGCVTYTQNIPAAYLQQIAASSEPLSLYFRMSTGDPRPGDGLVSRAALDTVALRVCRWR